MARIIARSVGIVRRLLDALLLALIVVVLAGVVLGKLVPLTGRETIVIGGQSMEPALPLGAAVIIRPVDSGALATGDIVSLRAGPQNTLYTHRIVAVVDRPDGRWVQTKGDANAELDPTLVPAGSIVGRSEMVVPLLGYLIVLMTIPAGILFLIGLAASFLAGAWLLESLELEPHERRPGGPFPTDRVIKGEPMAARPGVRSAAQLPSNIAPSKGAQARPTVAEQLAISRETRNRRLRWGSATLRRDDPRA
jgi:signal peptidase I